MPKFKVLAPIVHNEKRYEIDSPITLDDDTAAQLLAVGSIELPPAPEPEEDKKPAGKK